MATSDLVFFFGGGKISVSNEVVETTSLLAGNDGMTFTVFDANSTNALRSVSLRNDRSLNLGSMNEANKLYGTVSQVSVSSPVTSNWSRRFCQSTSGRECP